MAAEIVMANLLGILMICGLIFGMGAFFWRMTRSSIRKDEFIHAYFTASLKKHANKKDIDLETEIKETQGYGFWEHTSKNRAEAKQRRLNNSSIAQTDLLFEALDEEESKTKK